MTVSEEDLRDARQFLSDIGVWPDSTHLDIDGWLGNFEDGEDRELAVALLESYIHFNEREIAHAAISGFTALSGRSEFGPGDARQAAWESFLAEAIVTFPSGSPTDATGSGNIFARALRDAGYFDGRVLAPHDTVSRIAGRGLRCPVVFVDDLSGTGNQFCRTWERNIVTASGRLSFSELHQRGQLRAVYYVPFVATGRAVEAIAVRAPAVTVAPTYLLDTTYSASAPDTRLVPATDRDRLNEFLAKYAIRSGHDPAEPYGYGGLGLALSFHHGVPNNTVPVLQRRKSDGPPDWKALTR